MTATNAALQITAAADLTILSFATRRFPPTRGVRSSCMCEQAALYILVEQCAQLGIVAGVLLSVSPPGLDADYTFDPSIHKFGLRGHQTTLPGTRLDRSPILDWMTRQYAIAHRGASTRNATVEIVLKTTQSTISEDLAVAAAP